MKRNLPIFLLLGAFATVIGYLFSKVSWVGRIGIRLFYSEYGVFKSWWKSSLLVMVVFLLLYGIHWLVQRKAQPNTSKAVHFVAILVSLFGLYLTYNDFRQDLSHRWLGERFHLGFYLFWAGWITICLHFLFSRKNTIPTA